MHLSELKVFGKIEHSLSSYSSNKGCINADYTISQLYNISMFLKRHEREGVEQKFTDTWQAVWFSKVFP